MRSGAYKQMYKIGIRDFEGVDEDSICRNVSSV